MASTGRVVEKPSLDQQQQQQQPLKCPRCDSSNTKFCYYNNYSLSQPRHFCKACKRYWTRGGTLRNVPVGGGCRKNKRVKRPPSAIDSTTSSATAATGNPNNVQPQIDLSSSSNHINPLFYGIPTNPSELNPPFSRFNSSRVSNVDTVSGYDLHSQMNTLGLGFSSGLMATDAHNDYRNGFNSTKQIHDVTSNSIFSSFPFFGSSTSSSTSTTMASLIASSLQQQKYISGSKDIGEANSFQGIASYEDMQMAGRSQGSVGMKEIEMERGQSRLDWNVNCQNKMEQINSSDPSLLWNTTSAVAWLDQASIGSSVPSLI